MNTDRHIRFRALNTMVLFLIGMAVSVLLAGIFWNPHLSATSTSVKIEPAVERTSTEASVLPSVLPSGGKS